MYFFSNAKQQFHLIKVIKMSKNVIGTISEHSYRIPKTHALADTKLTPVQEVLRVLVLINFET